MVNYDDYTAADYDPAARKAKIRQLGYTGEFGGGKADSWLTSNYGTAKVANLSPSGVKPLTTASMNDFQKSSLYSLGTQPTAVNKDISKMYGKADTAISAGNAYTQKAAGMKYDPNSYKTFMNPYIEDVINRNASTIGRTYGAKRNDINQSFAEAGGYGSTAQGVERSLNSEAEARQIGDMDAQLRAQGYNTATDTALGVYDRDVANTLAAADRMYGASSLYSGLGGNQMGLDEYTRGVLRNSLLDKLTAGERIQQDQQAQLDAYYNEEKAASSYTPQQLALLAELLKSYPTGTTTTQSTSGGSNLTNMLGGALMGSSLYNNYQGSNSGATPWTSGSTMNSAGRSYYGF